LLLNQPAIPPPPIPDTAEFSLDDGIAAEDYAERHAPTNSRSRSNENSPWSGMVGGGMAAGLQEEDGLLNGDSGGESR